MQLTYDFLQNLTLVLGVAAVITPTGQERLQAGDILSLIGADTAIQAAKALLL